MPYYFGKDKGFFAAEQIEPQLVMMAPPTAIAALVAGELDFSSTTGAATSAIMRGLPLRRMFYVQQDPVHVLLAQPEIKSVQDLIGKPLGVTALTDAVGMSANVSRAWPLSTHMRVQVTGIVSGEKFRTYNGLGRFSGGGQAELQYRSSGAFDATTFAVVGRALYEQYESHYRTGPRYFVGFNARRALTDRIELFGELGHNWRYGESDVFKWKDYAAKLNERQVEVDKATTVVDPDSAQAGMAEMSQKFRDMGGQVYVDADKAKAANKALE